MILSAGSPGMTGYNLSHLTPHVPRFIYHLPDRREAAHRALIFLLFPLLLVLTKNISARKSCCSHTFPARRHCPLFCSRGCGSTRPGTSCHGSGRRTDGAVPSNVPSFQVLSPRNRRQSCPTFPHFPCMPLRLACRRLSPHPRLASIRLVRLNSLATANGAARQSAIG
jgi:hypothetical protein